MKEMCATYPYGQRRKNDNANGDDDDITNDARRVRSGEALRSLAVFLNFTEVQYQARDFIAFLS